MPKGRTFYRTRIAIEVLSEYRLSGNEDLSDIAYLIEDGPCSGKVETLVENEEVDARRMAQLLADQGSESGFFGLTEQGTDLYGTDGEESAEGEENSSLPIKRTLFIEKTIRYVATYQARDEEEASIIENQIEGNTDFSTYQILGTNTWTEED